MARYYFDVETNGFLDVLDRIHCLVLIDLDSDTLHSYADQPGYPAISEGLKLLESAEEIVGHNVIKFDIPAVQKTHPGWSPKGRVYDTLVAARVILPIDELRDRDFARKGRFPPDMIGRYSLEAFGHRIGNHKGDFAGPWEQWSVAMQKYCEQDCRLGVQIYRILKAKPDIGEAVQLEHDVQRIVARQERYGFLFDTTKAHTLHGRLLDRQSEVGRKLRSAFPPLFLPAGEKQTKRSARRKNPAGIYEFFTEGVTYTKVKMTEFNPASRTHIEKWLRRLRGWVPSEFTSDGKAKVDDDVISTLPWPEAKLLGEWLMLNKRIGQLATGREALLKHVKSDGRIHGGVNTNGAGSGRMTHSGPNMGQVPGLVDRKTGGVMPYGKDFRELLTVPAGYKLVGCDADALELRGLAGYMAPYDGGAYIDTVLKGNKAAGTDMHSVNMRALGFSARDPAKTWFYAFIYGAGAVKLGQIAGETSEREAARRGKRDREAFLSNLPAMGTLVAKVKDRAKSMKYLRGLDGRRIPVRSEHSALNALIQSCGAILMKKALVILDADLQEGGLFPGTDYEFVANVHDEFQIECKEQHAKTVGETAKAAMRKAGEHFKFACPIDGNYGIGTTWADTH